MQGVAAGWLMTQMTFSPVWVSMIPAASMLPALLLGLPGGALADHWDRRRWLIVTQSWMSACAIALALLTVSGLATPVLLLVFLFLLGIGNALNLPAWASLVQDVVPRGQTAAAVALGAVNFNSARVVGPALGGLVVAAFGTATVFFLNSFSFFFTLLVLFTMRGIERPPRESRSLRDRFRGLGKIVVAPHLRGAFLRVAGLSFFGSWVFGLLPLLAREQLALSAIGYGWLLGTFGGGALVGGLAVTALRNVFRPAQIVAVCGLLVAVGVTGLAASAAVAGAALGLFCAGLGWTSMMINLNVAVQTSVPGAMRGRALSCYFMLLQGSFAAGAVASGWVAKFAGMPGALLLSAGAMVAVVVLTARVPLPDHSPEGFGDGNPSSNGIAPVC